jgi:hypothetical protein
VDGDGELSLKKSEAVLTPWRIFIIEALITLVFSFVSYIFIIPFPEDSTIFTPEEKSVLLARLKADGGNVKNDQITVRKTLSYLLDWKIILT